LKTFGYILFYLLLYDLRNNIYLTSDFSESRTQIQKEMISDKHIAQFTYTLCSTNAARVQSSVHVGTKYTKYSTSHSSEFYQGMCKKIFLKLKERPVAKFIVPDWGKSFHGIGVIVPARQAT
jgi:hypothetical protein